MWKYCSNISQLGFFIFYIISLFNLFITAIRFCFLFSFFLCYLLHHTRYLYPHPFFFFFSTHVPALSFSFHLLQLALSGFFFFFFSSSSIHVFPYLFISPFFSFFFSLIQEVLSLFFFLQLSVSDFFFLLDSRTAVVFVRRVGGRGHLCNFTLRAAFSPQFSSRFGRKKIGGSRRKIFSRIFHHLCFPLLPKQWKTSFSTHCFPSSL